MKQIAHLAFLALLAGTAAEARTEAVAAKRPFIATAFAQSGITRSGKLTRRGLVAADLNVLPLGTEILVKNAGRYSGTYTVADTGSKVIGRHIDIYMPSVREALTFGRRHVEVSVLEWGQGPAARFRRNAVRDGWS
ncbi:MAG TPA: 3D domain-containing protein [Bryobacteraceae bacterium]|nr:3D domain-containing protein [Bryobacteraceae bacterium]